MEEERTEITGEVDSGRGEMPDDRLEVRIFTIADHAVFAPDGKLYMNGGGIEIMRVQQLPGPLGPSSLALRLRFPWNATSETHRIVVRALDADRKPVGPDPVLEARAEVGRAPGQRPGDEIGVNLAVALTGLPVQIPDGGTVYFHLSVDDQPLSILPLKLRRVQVAQLRRGQA